ncbi:Concanavalin A-like lectin/glucanases superfamily protein [Mesonia phycicola]|uniref:Concanavalin A-like lectin/glucanases superfamily protein n=1 Tax=Mesonia phycicola TaxID=579105 RepID=A0A1M6CKE5_9FLAO|nr:LamG-like jellyroll fold domain-containing protein [Mesonia phycicola]SHI61492.1 Concanavalin A-like lectin/glucanases superfamily protein [Mesonia phycicola]
MLKKNIFKKISILSLVVVATIACQQESIDDITSVDPGTDESAPVVEITSPSDGMSFQTTAETTMLDIAFEVIDDIEVVEISVSLNGEEIEYYNEFTDYRIVPKEIAYELGDGDYTLTVQATDIVGNITTDTVSFSKSTVDYLPQFDEEAFYMNFNGNYTEFISNTEITVVGQPGYAGEAKVGSNAYAGNTDSYLTAPVDGLTSENFSATFWYKVNAVPDRAGILVAGPEDTENPDAQILRTSGFRLFREASGSLQVIKLNVGTGDAESWNDGGTVDPAAGEWAHIAFTISATETKIYINGALVNTATLATPMSWSGTEFFSIMSGAPRFAGWGHLSDSSYIDDLRFFTKELTEDDIMNVMEYTEE